MFTNTGNVSKTKQLNLHDGPKNNVNCIQLTYVKYFLDVLTLTLLPYKRRA